LAFDSVVEGPGEEKELELDSAVVHLGEEKGDIGAALMNKSLAGELLVLI
jgi:hypothetical protein